MVDVTLILRKLSELDEYYGQIKEYEKITVNHYDNIDAEIVVGILKKDLKDFLSYKEVIINCIKPGNAQQKLP